MIFKEIFLSDREKKIYLTAETDPLMCTRIKNVFIFSVAGFLLFTGCKKERYICGYSYTYFPGSVVFSGFSAAALKTVVVGRYTAGSNFSALIGQDTLDASAGYFEGDTVYNSSKDGFFQTATQVDYKISLPEAGRVFELTGIRQLEKDYTWEQNERCGIGSVQTRFRPYAHKLDGIDYVFTSGAGNKWYIYLVK